MKRSIPHWLAAAAPVCVALTCVALPAHAASAPSQPHRSLPPRADILALMHKVDDWQTAHPVMAANDRNWERGTWYTGVMGAWKTTGDAKFLDQALDYGRQNNWQVGTEKAGANRLFIAETWVELYLAKHDPQMIAPTEQWLATNAPNSPGGAKRWYLDSGRPYIDSLYGAPVFAMLARAIGDRKYLDTLHAFTADLIAGLWDEDAGLFYRDSTYIGKRTARGKKVLWSRGNGWAFAGLARLLEYLPKNDPDRARYLALYRRMAASIAERQSPDGFWRANLDDSEDIPNPESSGTAFFCFGYAWGIRHHLLDRRKYLPVAEKAYAALAGAVSPEGMVQWGQQVDAQPHATPRSSSHEYVTGAFLLASGEMYRLSR
ncbi:MAG TPA: glycoside hydrolase family 88 protein [Terracidiphilus sp.]|jgi:rhamnogalacturonyl hydrolase YesR|nr:glycoside hydrolase family 88 protein [Terracidiphilus sp.]